MNADIKAQWIAALRSGEYTQTQSRLCDVDGFCCLGVLCDISGIGTWSRNEYRIGDVAHDATLPLEVALWAGFVEGDYNDGNGPVVEIDTKRECVSEFNDEYVPFLRIANAIEKSDL